MYNHCIKCLPVSYKIEHMVILWLSNSSLSPLLKRNENMSTEYMYKKVHGSFNHHSKNLKTSKGFSSRRMAPWRGINNGTLQSNEKG